MKLANSDDSQITIKFPKNIDRNNFLDKELTTRPNRELKERRRRRRGRRQVKINLDFTSEIRDCLSRSV